MSNLTNTKNSWLKDIGFIIVQLGILFGAFLGTRPLSVPDEARYSEIPREMLELGDFLTPHLNYIKYFEKPPLLYWLQSGAIKMFGLSEWALRLPTALLALCGCIIVYSAARLLYDRLTALLASFILATSLLYFSMAHLITLDMTVSVFLTTSLLGFIVGVVRNEIAIRYSAFWLCYASAGLAMLAKGLIAVALPGLVIAVWIGLYHQWRVLTQCYLFSGILIFLLIAGPWYLWVQKVNPEFFHFFFIEQHFSRYLTLSAGRFQPYWFFIPILLLGFFPWIVFLPQAIQSHLPDTWRNRAQKKVEGYLMLWAVLILLFFSLSKSKLIPYILPVFPALAILTGHYLAKAWQGIAVKGLKTGFCLLPVCALAIATALIALPHYQTVSDPLSATFYLRIMACCLIAGSLLTAIIFWRKQFHVALIFLLASTMLEFIIFIVAVPYVDTRSIKPLAQTLNPLLHPGDEVVSYGIYFQDLPFYLRQRVTIVEWKNELTFGLQHQADVNWMIDNNAFIKKWHVPKKIYAVMAKDKYRMLQQRFQLKLYPLAETTDNVLATNHPS